MLADVARARLRHGRRLGRAPAPRLGDGRACRGGARGARAARPAASRRTRRGSSPANVERACELALALGTTIDRRRLLGRAGGDRARARAARRPARDREPPGARRRREHARADRERERAAPACSAPPSTPAGGGRTATTPRRAIEELAEHVLHVHLKDVRAVGEPHETCRWGEGVVDDRGVRARAAADRLRRARSPSSTSRTTHDPSDDVRAMRARAASDGWRERRARRRGNIAARVRGLHRGTSRGSTLAGVTDSCPARADALVAEHGGTRVRLARRRCSPTTRSSSS